MLPRTHGNLSPHFTDKEVGAPRVTQQGRSGPGAPSGLQSSVLTCYTSGFSSEAVAYAVKLNKRY